MTTERRDGRKLGHKTLEEIRLRAVARVQAGESPEVVIKALGFTRSCIYAWLAKYREQGAEGLRARQLAGRPLKLNGKQVRWLYQVVTLKNPLQFKFPFALWTRGMIQELVWERFQIKLNVVSIGRLLARLGLSCQKPLYRAYQQNPSRVEQWLKTEYPAIRAAARAAGAIIYFGDEAGVRSDFHAGTTWAKRGQTPVVEATGARFGLNMISAVSAQGHFRFMVAAGRVNAAVLCEFLDRLMRGARKPVFLILDGHPMHKAKLVQACVACYQGRLKLFFLPPYSPEINPDELVWNDVKNQKVGRSIVKSLPELRSLVTAHLEWIQKTPALVKSFFQHPKTSYAAEYV
jgi:transposase